MNLPAGEDRAKPFTRWIGSRQNDKSTLRFPSSAAETREQGKQDPPGRVEEGRRNKR